MSALTKKKLVLLGLMTALINGPYYALQHVQLFSIRAMPVTEFDRAIPLIESTIWLYLSLFALLPLPLLLIRSETELIEMARGFALITIISHIIFLVWPNEIPLNWRPDTTIVGFPFSLVLRIDKTINACPSLHASLALYCACCVTRMIKAQHRSQYFNLGLWLWVIGILFATISTRQHVVIDLLAGAILAGIIYSRIFHSKKKRELTDAEIEQPAGEHL